jgi:CMP-N-acetylneuraminic acid synthetase
MITVDIDTEKDWKIAEILYNSIERTVRADG